MSATAEADTVEAAESKRKSLEEWPLTNPIELASCDGTQSCCLRSMN